MIGLVLVPFLLGELGREGYGLVALVATIVAFAEIADLGLRGALGRHLAEQVATKDVRRFNELASSAMAFYLTAGIVLAVACMLLAPLLVRAFNVSDALRTQAVFMIRWYGGFTIILAFIRPVYGAAITSNKRFDLLNYVSIGQGILSGIGLFLVLGLTKAGLYGWAAVVLLFQVASMEALRRIAHRVNPGLRIRLRLFSRSAMRALFALGGYVFLLRIVQLVSLQSGPLVLSVLMGPAALALYSPALRVTSVAGPFVGALARQLYPLATGLHVTGQTKRLQAVLIRGTKYTFLMAIAVYVLLGIFAEPIARVWLERSLGPDYRTVAWVLMGMAVVHLFMYTAGTQYPVLLGMTRLKFLAWIQLPLVPINILASIVLVRYTSLGVLGVVAATLAVMLIRRPIVAAYAARSCGLSVGSFFLKSYFRPFIVLVILGGAGVALRLLVDPSSLPALAACALIMGVLWLGLCAFVGFNQEDRRSFSGLFGGIWEHVLRRRLASQATGASLSEALEEPDAGELGEFNSGPDGHREHE